MPYIQPSAINISPSDSDYDGEYANVYAAVDNTIIPADTPVQARADGFGVVDPITGQFEVLDAIPLRRRSAQLAVETGSAGRADIDFSSVDYYTEAEGNDSDLVTQDNTNAPAEDPPADPPAEDPAP